MTTTLNVFPAEPEARRRLEALQAWARSTAPQLLPLLDPRANIGPYLLSPSGDLLVRIDAQDELIPELTRAIAAQRIRPDHPLLRRPPRLFREPIRGRLALRLTSQFVEEVGEAPRLPQPPPWVPPMRRTMGTSDYNQRMYRLRRATPTREGLLIPQERLVGLFPPPGPPPQTWPVEAALARELLWLFRPSTHQFRLSQADVRVARLQASLLDARGSNWRVALTGQAAIRQGWFPVSGEGLWLGDRLSQDYQAESTIQGYADLDPARRRVLKLRLVTDGALYRGRDGARLPFASALDSLSEEAASDESSAPEG